MRIRLILRVVVFASASLALVATGCDAVDGERIVKGQVPPEHKTIEVEEACGRLSLPADSTRLKTNILSKRYSGVITNTYSTNHPCDEIASFFNKSLLPAGWIQVENQKYGLFDMGARSVFASEAFAVEMSCTDIRDYRGIKRFSISCSWESN